MKNAATHEDANVVGVDHDARERRTFLAPATVLRLAQFAIGALAIGLVFWWLQSSTDAICCGDFDGYYHIGWSQQLWQGLRSGRLPQFTWLPLTTLNAHDYVDHHFLFHILQIPFTFFSDVRTGAKISAWLFASLALFACYWMILRYRIKYPLLWLVALLGCSAPFLFRMNMTKAMSVSVVLLVIGIHLLFQKKYLWLLPLAFFFTLTYDMFVLLGLAAAIWTAVVAWSERRFEWRPLAWVAVGTFAGTLINPYFPHNLRLLYEHIAMKVAVKAEGRPAVGQEWYPYESWDFVGNCAVAFIAMVTGYIAFNPHDRKRAAQALFLLIFSTILLVANARYRRFAEYWPPFAVLFAAFALQLVFERARAYTRLPDDVIDELQPYLDRHERPDVGKGNFNEGWAEIEAFVLGLVLSVLLFRVLASHGLGAGLQIALMLGAYIFLALPYFKMRGARMAMLTTVSLILFISMLITVKAESSEIATTARHEKYTKGIEWMRTHVPAGQVIFNTDWDDFPKLFYYDPTHAYISGLDPTYIYDRDNALSRLYEDITLGRNKDPGPAIRDRFGARYVFTDNEDVHNDFYDAALDSGWFDEVYTDEDCTVLYIRDQKGTPPTADEPGDNPNDKPDEDTGDNIEETE